jgi:hypothetical protein
VIWSILDSSSAGLSSSVHGFEGRLRVAAVHLAERHPSEWHARQQQPVSAPGAACASAAARRALNHQANQQAAHLPRSCGKSSRRPLCHCSAWAAHRSPTCGRRQGRSSRGTAPQIMPPAGAGGFSRHTRAHVLRRQKCCSALRDRSSAAYQAGRPAAAMRSQLRGEARRHPPGQHVHPGAEGLEKQGRSVTAWPKSTYRRASSGEIYTTEPVDGITRF